MKTLVTRSLSGIVFAAIMLLGIWYSRWSFTILFLIVNVGCLWEYFTITKSLYTPGKISANVYRGVGVILGTIIYMLFAARSMWLMPAEGVLLFVIVLYGFMMLELLSLSPQAIRNAAINVFGLVYISTALGMLLLIVQRVSLYEDAYDWYPMLVAPALGLLLLIWANDTFAYLGGSLIGRNKLYAAISPGKTWEGFFVGMIFSAAAAYGLYRYFGIYNLKVWIGLALIASIIGTIGDLFESMIKRNVGIKDSGKIMPGHGGFLDRFDAFLFCAPFAWLWFHLAT